MVIDHITANGASIAFIQETWLKEMNNHTTSVIKAHGFLIHHFCRGNSGGGGVAVIFKPSIKLVRVFISHGDSFEAVSVKVVLPNAKNLLCSCIYRTGSLTSFYQEFDEYLDEDRFLLKRNFRPEIQLVICNSFKILVVKMR